MLWFWYTNSILSSNRSLLGSSKISPNFLAENGRIFVLKVWWLLKFRLRIYLLWGTGQFQNSSLRLFCSMEILWNTYFQVCLRHLEIFITYKTCWNFWSPFECIGLWNTATLALFLFYTFFYLFHVFFFTMSFSASVFPSTSDKLESKSATLAGSYTALNMAF